MLLFTNYCKGKNVDCWSYWLNTLVGQFQQQHDTKTFYQGDFPCDWQIPQPCISWKMSIFNVYLQEPSNKKHLSIPASSHISAQLRVSYILCCKLAFLVDYNVLNQFDFDVFFGFGIDKPKLLTSAIIGIIK